MEMKRSLVYGPEKWGGKPECLRERKNSIVFLSCEYNKKEAPPYFFTRTIQPGAAGRLRCGEGGEKSIYLFFSVPTHTHFP